MDDDALYSKDPGHRAALPLAGVRVVVTRPRDRADRLIHSIVSLGGEPIACPLIRTVATADPGRMDDAARELPGYDWVVFTSVAGVRHFWDALVETESSFEGVSIAAIGPATQAALEARGARPQLIPEAYVAESLLAGLRRQIGADLDPKDLSGVRVLLPVAADARQVLVDGLREVGAVVDRIEAYRTVGDAEGSERLREVVATDGADVVTLTSPSTVARYDRIAGEAARRMLVAVIGPVTAAEARRRGLSVGIEADEYTSEGLVRAIVDYFDREPHRPDRV